MKPLRLEPAPSLKIEITQAKEDRKRVLLPFLQAIKMDLATQKRRIANKKDSAIQRSMAMVRAIKKRIVVLLI